MLMEHMAHSLHLHPMLVHFPIALFIGALGFEIVSLIFKKDEFHRTALGLYILAAVISPLVVQAGFWEEDAMGGIHHPVFENHEKFALLTMWTALASLPVLWFTQKKAPQWLRKVFVFFVFFTALTVFITAYYGGHMVYDYGIGIEEH